MAERKETNAEFAAILDKLKRGKPVVLAASTHDGEEVLIAVSYTHLDVYKRQPCRRAAAQECGSWKGPAALTTARTATAAWNSV